MVGLRSVPEWLDSLLNEQFFDPCSVHSHDDRKHEKNLFCFDCCSSVCPSCACRHRKHVIVQVRRYVYHDVLKLSDAQKLVDCSGIQGYITNSAKVIFLKERPLSRKIYKGRQSSCFTCNRNLQDPFIFCCLSCKVKHILATQGTLEIKLSTHTQLNFSDVDECLMTPDSVLDSPGSNLTTSGSTDSTDLRTALLCTATTEIVRKKRSNLSAHHGQNRVPFCSEPADTHVNRRKRVPNRAPLC